MPKKFLNIEGLNTLWQIILAKLATKADKSFSKIVAGNTTMEAGSPADTLTIINGSGATVTANATKKQITFGLATSGVTASTYRSVTVDNYGRVTAGTNPTTLAGHGITDAKINNRTITLGGNSITVMSSQEVTNAIESAVVSTFKFKGVSTFANLPNPASGNVGDLYSITDAFTIDNRFIEYSLGGNLNIEAGTDVVIIDHNGEKKYNLMYKDDINSLTANEITAICV